MNKFIYEENFTLNTFDLPIEYNKSTSSNIKKFENIIFKSNVICYQNIDSCSFEDCDFEGNINLYYGDLNFKNCTFKETIHNIKFGVNASLLFEKCIFEIDFQETRNINFGSIFFINCVMKNIVLKYLGTSSLYFNDTTFSNLEIKDISIIKQEKNILTGDFLPFYIEINSNKKLGNIEIDGIINLENLHIGDTRNQGNFENIVLKNLNFLSGDNHSYIINDSKINKLDIRYCTNFSNKLILQNLELLSLFIKNTDLGKTTFNGVDIKKLYLENVTLNDCIFNGVEFPLNYELEKNELSNKKLRDIYRQLKYIMDKNSNHIEANKFFEKEMFYYMEYLNGKEILEKGWYKKLKENFFTGDIAKLISEKISLRLGYSISEFGNNWILPIFLIILLSLLIVDVFYLLDNFKSFIDYHNNIINNIIVDFSISKMIVQIIGYALAIFLVLRFYKFIIKYYPIFFILLFAIFIQFTGYPIITNFIEFLYPFHGLFDYDYLKGLSTLKLGIFILYKIIYAVLIWHLLVALKRTTKR